MFRIITMNVRLEEKGSVTVIYLEGNVMGGPEGATLHETLHELKDSDRNQVVVELSAVKFLNSSGLGMLVSGMTSLRNAGGDLRLCNVAEKIHSLLIITKLSSVFKIFQTVEEAVASYQD